MRLRLTPLLAAALLFAACDAPPSEPPLPAEMRGVWLTNVDSDVLASRASIAEAMQFLADHGFNTVYPVVWNKGVTLYPSAVMDSIFGIPIDTLYADRDPLQEVVEEARAHGLQVIPWFEFGFASSYVQNGRRFGGHIVDQKPDWMARDRDGGILTKNNFEWMNAYHPEVQGLLRALIFEVADRYDVDGIQGDDRLPAQPIEGGYSAYTDSLYRADHDGAAPPRDFRDPAWQRWRGDRLNAFGETLYRDFKAAHPDLVVSWSPSIYPWSYDEYLQDWPSWVNGGYADVVHPQVYRYTFDAYQRALASQHADSIGLDRPEIVTPGVLMKVGDYVIAPGMLDSTLAENRRQGYDGEVFFFYEGLVRNDSALAKQLRDTYYAAPARAPFE